MSLLYEKTAKIIEAKIEDGTYPVSMRLPGEDRLAKELDIARPTLHKAILLLEAKGLIECRSSVGNFVLKSPKSKRLYAYIAPDLSDPFHAEFISIFNKNVVAAGGSLLIDDNSNTSTEKIIRRLKDENVDGVVFCHAQRDDSIFLKNSDIPAVWLSSVPECKTIDYIVMNNEQGIKAVLEHLRNSRINTVGYAEGWNQSKFSIRKETFSENISQYGLSTEDSWILKIKNGGESGGRELFELFTQLEKRPEALVCYNDWNAIGFIEAALDYGIKIPQELRVIGFDNLMLSKFFRVPLTTVDCNLPALAAKAYKMISARINNLSMERQVYIEDCSLIVRKS